jgi:hypothetical protein
MHRNVCRAALAYVTASPLEPTADATGGNNHIDADKQHPGLS